MFIIKRHYWILLQPGGHLCPVYFAGVFPTTSNLQYLSPQAGQAQNDFTHQDNSWKENSYHKCRRRVPYKLIDIYPFIPGKNQSVHCAQKKRDDSQFALQKKKTNIMTLSKCWFNNSHFHPTPVGLSCCLEILSFICSYFPNMCFYKVHSHLPFLFIRCPQHITFG